ncbi:hypothetical protein [uncultured Pseudonocardia sp.]|uniref:hypothetical protein n=1 Tax=uncultured Pseudonocardia sp. TaxID=211455 RepID=UPI00262E2E23|nr:hypothetical protein [uncultured Pseudonocardia sp.]
MREPHPDQTPPPDTEPADSHLVVVAELRAQIALGEAHRRGALAHVLPDIVEGITAMPRRVRELIEHGHPRSAEYWLLQAERFAQVITGPQLQQRVTALGSFQLQSHLQRCACRPGTCRS